VQGKLKNFLIIFIKLRRYEMTMKGAVLSLFFVICFVVILSLGVSAQTTCSSSQVIMRLSGSTNAHGEVWNGGGGYTTEICYDTIFGSSYSGQNPHACASSNKVVRLSTLTNAHAEIPGNNNYGTEVCYGDLSCTSVAGNAPCPSGKTEIVSLSSSTNAHLGVAGSYNGAGNYKICCSRGIIPSLPSPQIFNATWNRFDGSRIASDAFVCPNSSAIMSVQTKDIFDGSSIQFQLYDKDPFPNPDDLIGSALTTIVRNGRANFTLNLSNPVLLDQLRTELGRTLEEKELELYFKSDSSSISNVSYVVRYDGNVSSCTYSKPAAKIYAPVHRGVYFANTNINFVSGCSSQIGPSKSDWIVTQNGNEFTETGAQFEHDFANAGQVNVKLKCTDPRGSSISTESQMLVVSADKRVLAFIEKPSLDEFVYNSPPSRGPYFPETVRFSALDSFVVEVNPNNNNCLVTCLGGYCPQMTNNSLSNCAGGTGGPVPIVNAPSSGSVADYKNLFFNWTFWDRNWDNQWTSFEGLDKKEGAILYDDLSNQINDKHMSVSINYVNGVNATFKRDFTLGRCLNSGNTYYGPNSQPLSTNLPNDACKGGDDAAGTGDDCCSVGFQCLPSGDSKPYSCQLTTGATRCEDFDNKMDCASNNDSRIPRASYGQSPPECTFLECFWDTGSNSCGVKATQYSSGANGCKIVGGGVNPPVCSWTTHQTECLSGKKTISYAVVNGGDRCNRNSVEVLCGSLNFELSFFGKSQFIISALSIATLYFVFSVYRRKRYDQKKR